MENLLTMIKSSPVTTRILQFVLFFCKLGTLLSKLHWDYKTKKEKKHGKDSGKRLNLDKHLRIKISDKSFAQRFDVAMTSFSSDKNKIQTLIANFYS